MKPYSSSATSDSPSHGMAPIILVMASAWETMEGMAGLRNLGWMDRPRAASVAKSVSFMVASAMVATLTSASPLSALRFCASMTTALNTSTATS